MRRMNVARGMNVTRGLRFQPPDAPEGGPELGDTDPIFERELRTQADINSLVYLEPCRHWYFPEDIRRWVLTSRREGRPPTCPMCRSVIREVITVDEPHRPVVFSDVVADVREAWALASVETTAALDADLPDWMENDNFVLTFGSLRDSILEVRTTRDEHVGHLRFLQEQCEELEENAFEDDDTRVFWREMSRLVARVLERLGAS